MVSPSMRRTDSLNPLKEDRFAALPQRGCGNLTPSRGALYNLQTVMRNNVPHSGSPVQVIDRAVALLEELAVDSRPRSLAALSAAVGLSKTTTRRVLMSLEQHGFCERAATGEYRLGLRLFALGMLVRERLDLRDRSKSVLEWLAETTQLTVFLCIREDDRAICIERLDGRFAHTLALRIGGTLPLHTGASPLVLLAYSSDEEIEQYLASHERLEKFTGRTMTSSREVRRAIADCRAHGFVVSDQDVTDGVAAIGAPVFDHTGAVVAAVSVSGLTSHVLGDREARIVEAVCSAGARISGQLGFAREVMNRRSDQRQRATTARGVLVPQTVA